MAAKTKAVLEAAEKTLDEIEPVLERIESELDQTAEAAVRIPKLRLNGTTKKQQILILSITAGVSAAATGLIVWKVVQKRETLRYEAILEQELAETRAFYQSFKKPDLKDLGAKLQAGMTNPSSLTQAVEAIKQYDKVGSEEAPPKEVPQVVTTNIFVEGKPMEPDDFDYDAELPNRSIDTPYVISHDEFMQGEKEYVQSSLRWFDGDDVLTDDKNVPIDEVDLTVGECIRQFGHGSKDPRIVYVRNERMEVDFEVVKDDGTYAEYVGFKHSDRPASRKVRRSRVDDDE